MLAQLDNNVEKFKLNFVITDVKGYPIIDRAAPRTAQRTAPTQNLNN